MEVSGNMASSDTAPITSRSAPYGTFEDDEAGRPRRPSNGRAGSSPQAIIPTKSSLEADAEDFKHHKKLKVKQIFTEFFGTGMFIFFGGMSLHNREGNVIVHADIVAIALAHGLTIAILISGLGHISGGHFNPAVSLGVYLAGGVSFLQMIAYWLSQLLGGFIGGLFIRAVTSAQIYMYMAGGTLNLNADVATAGEGCVLELIMTFLLVLTVLMVAVDPLDGNIYAPFAIGLSITVDVFAGGTITGASMNPARSFGSLAAYASLFADQESCKTFVNNPKTPNNVVCAVPKVLWATHWIAWVGPLCGAIIAALLYRCLFASPRKNWLIKDE